MKRLIGYDSESQDHNPETLRRYLYGGHVADYMRHLMEEDEEKYKTHFARFIKEGITADGVSMNDVLVLNTSVIASFQLEQMYKDAHAKIREDPSFTKKAPREDIKKKRWVRLKIFYRGTSIQGQNNFSIIGGTFSWAGPASFQPSP